MAYIQIELEIRGGKSEVTELPDGITLVIRDYDVGGADADCLERDANGQPCRIATYHNGPDQCYIDVGTWR